MDEGIETVRGRLNALAGTPLDDEEVTKLLVDILTSGGGIQIELDSAGYKLIRRDGRFVLTRDARPRTSSMPPRR